MIVGLRGTVRDVEPGALILSVGPVELRLAVPTSTTARLSPGDEGALRTHLYVRENQIALYGFGTASELEVFEQLIGVSGVGPKMALALLSTLEPREIEQAIRQRDARLLTRAPGVGARAAERIVADLQGKLSLPAAEISDHAIPIALGGAVSEALIGLGYSVAQTKSALDRLPPDVSGSRSVEETLRLALGALAEL